MYTCLDVALMSPETAATVLGGVDLDGSESKYMAFIPDVVNATLGTNHSFKSSITHLSYANANLVTQFERFKLLPVCVFSKRIILIYPADGIDPAVAVAMIGIAISWFSTTIVPFAAVRMRGMPVRMAVRADAGPSYVVCSLRRLGGACLRVDLSELFGFFIITD